MFLCFGKTKNNIIPTVIKHKNKLFKLIATINVVKQVPKFAPIIMPKHSSSFIYLEDNSEIAIAVIPDEDCIMADDKAPNTKLLNFVFTNFEIRSCSLDENR